MKQLFFLLLLFVSPIVFSQTDDSEYISEHILSFESDMTIQKNRKINITETITVYSRGVQMVHGIYRELPLEYEFEGGVNTVDFQLNAIKCDGKTEDYHTEDMDNGIRIYMGSKDRTLPIGKHVYEINYTVDHVLGIFDKYDEFYWNINGNGWSFIIDTVRATVHLPKGAQLKQYRGYTGSFGQAGTDFTVDTISDGLQFETTRYFTSGENLTVAIGWNKGAITYPTSSDSFIYWLKTHFLLIFSVFGLLVLSILQIRLWIKYGRDPKPGTIMPQYGPPTGFTPGDCTYVYNNNGKVNLAFTSQLIGIATKGHMSIEKEEGSFLKGDAFTFTNTEDAKNNRPLAPSEKELYKDFFGSGNVVFFREKTYNPHLKAVLETYTEALQQEHGEKYILKNGKKIAITFGYIVVYILLQLLFKWLFGGSAAIIIVSAVVSLIGLGLFTYLIQQPTALGRKILDHLEGFKMYMEYADKERIRLNNPPTMDFEHWEANLPYAIALGVAKEWSNQFDPKELERGFSTGHIWYGAMMAHGIHSFDMSSMSSSISSAATPPSKSSGSGGGGFSGGGGGGGGGGGW